VNKLAIHVAAALLFVYQARKAEWPWWGIVLGLIVVATVVHLVYDFISSRFFAGPHRHLGAAAISNDDPLMTATIAEARRTWPDFLELFARYPKDSLVKFRLRVASGEIENVWGDLLELEGESATAYLRTPPVGKVSLPSRQLTFPVEEVVDWQVMVEDGSLRGGFTQQATFRILERENGSLHPKLAEQLARYRPLAQSED
jgi:hypothetical protein